MQDVGLASLPGQDGEVADRLDNNPPDTVGSQYPPPLSLSKWWNHSTDQSRQNGKLWNDNSPPIVLFTQAIHVEQPPTRLNSFVTSSIQYKWQTRQLPCNHTCAVTRSTVYAMLTISGKTSRTLNTTSQKCSTTKTNSALNTVSPPAFQFGRSNIKFGLNLGNINIGLTLHL